MRSRARAVAVAPFALFGLAAAAAIAADGPYSRTELAKRGKPATALVLVEPGGVSGSGFVVDGAHPKETRMTIRGLVIGFSFLVIVLLHAAFSSSSSAAADQRDAKTEKKAVTLTLKITDKPSGLSVDAKKVVPSRSIAFDVLRDMVGVKYKMFAKLGPFVTGLCGVDAPDGVYWALYVDGKFSDVGIGSITLEKDTCVTWKTQKGRMDWDGKDGKSEKEQAAPRGSQPPG